MSEIKYFGMDREDCPYHSLINENCAHRLNSNNKCSEENCPVKGIKKLFKKKKLW